MVWVPGPSLTGALDYRFPPGLGLRRSSLPRGTGLFSAFGHLLDDRRDVEGQLQDVREFVERVGVEIPKLGERLVADERLGHNFERRGQYVYVREVFFPQKPPRPFKGSRLAPQSIKELIQPVARPRNSRPPEPSLVSLDVLLI